MMDREPKPAPFQVGTHLRCVDDKHTTFVLDNLTGSKAMIYGPGLEVVVEEVKYGRQGTLRHLTDEDGPMYYEDSGEPILDRTSDWCSVYYVIGQDGQRHGRLIHRKDKKNWTVVK